MQKNKSFDGAWTALITPMSNGQVDYADLEKMVEFQIEGGISGIVSVGTTGESPTLSHEEHLEVIKKTVEFAKGRIPILAGTGSNSTTEAISLTKLSEDVGADGFLIVAPYYNKPSQEGVYRHFAEIAKSTKKPIMLYSIPGRCGIEISVDTTIRLRKDFLNIIGIKEAGGSCEKVSLLRQKSDADFIIMSGDDSLTLPFISNGAKGIISVASNLYPKEISIMTKLMLAGNLPAAQKISFALADLFKKFFIEPNPVPVKYALARAGLIKSDEVRLPLCEMSDEHKKVVADALDIFAKISK